MVDLHLHLIHINLDVNFHNFSLNVPTKLYSFYPLAYVLGLCQMLSSIMAPWMDPLLKLSNCCSHHRSSVSLESSYQEINALKFLKAVWVTSKIRLMCHESPNSSLFLPCQTLFCGLRTKTSGLKAPFASINLSVSPTQLSFIAFRTSLIPGRRQYSIMKKDQIGLLLWMGSVPSFNKAASMPQILTRLKWGLKMQRPEKIPSVSLTLGFSSGSLFHHYSAQTKVSNWSFKHFTFFTSHQTLTNGPHKSSQQLSPHSSSIRP